MKGQYHNKSQQPNNNSETTNTNANTRFLDGMIQTKHKTPISGKMPLNARPVIRYLEN